MPMCCGDSPCYVRCRHHARLIRALQDVDKQIGAAVGTLNNLLAAPTVDCDEKAVIGT